MSVHVNSFDPFSSDHDGEFLAYLLLSVRLLSVGTFEETAAAEDDAGGDGGRAGLQKITACGHDNFYHGSFLQSCLLSPHLYCAASFAFGVTDIGALRPRPYVRPETNSSIETTKIHTMEPREGPVSIA
jgi:hypothetical protein